MSKLSFINKTSDELSENVNHPLYKKFKKKISECGNYAFHESIIITIFESKMTKDISVIHYCGVTCDYSDECLSHIHQTFEEEPEPLISEYTLKSLLTIKNMEFDWKKFLCDCTKFIISPNDAFTLTYFLIKKIKDQTTRIIFKKKLTEMFKKWQSITLSSDKIKWILSLQFSKEKTVEENILDLTLFNFLESFHHSVLIHYLNKFDTTKINFVIGQYVTHTPFVCYVNDIFINNDSIADTIQLKVGLVHIQLYIINENYNFVYDPDEYQSTELLCRTSGKLNEYEILNVIQIQSVTDDIYCLFHALRLISEIHDMKITKFNTDELKKINKRISFEGKIRIKKMDNWIISFVNEFS